MVRLWDIGDYILISEVILWNKFQGVGMYIGDRIGVELKVIRVRRPNNCGKRHFMGHA